VSPPPAAAERTAPGAGSASAAVWRLRPRATAKSPGARATTTRRVVRQSLAAARIPLLHVAWLLEAFEENFSKLDYSVIYSRKTQQLLQGPGSDADDAEGNPPAK